MDGISIDTKFVPLSDMELPRDKMFSFKKDDEINEFPSSFKSDTISFPIEAIKYFDIRDDFWSNCHDIELISNDERKVIKDAKAKGNYFDESNEPIGYVFRGKNNGYLNPLINS